MGDSALSIFVQFLQDMGLLVTGGLVAIVLLRRYLLIGPFVPPLRPLGKHRST
ncbi:MAG: hypothetical protein AB7G11_04745 [Phycisphaerales bacterium]